MRLEIGKIYKFRGDLDTRVSFPFGYKVGEFIGYTTSNWPRFKLNKKGTECFINATDNCFEEVFDIKEIKRLIIGKEYELGNIDVLEMSFHNMKNELLSEVSDISDKVFIISLKCISEEDWILNKHKGGKYEW